MAEEWTILKALEWTEQRLAREGEGKNPRLAAQMLASHATGLTRIELYTNFDKPLTEDERAVLRESIQRRLNNEPLQYIIGHVGFRHLELAVRSPVLIPRPETESLVELVIEYVANSEFLAKNRTCARDLARKQELLAKNRSCALILARKVPNMVVFGNYGSDFGVFIKKPAKNRAQVQILARNLQKAAKNRAQVPLLATAQVDESCATQVNEPCATQFVQVLDIGTGSGAIALSLLHELPDSKLYATDIDEVAIVLASENASALKLDGEGHLKLLKDDLASSFVADDSYHGYFDVVVSNPPYIPSAECDTLPAEILQHESRVALDGGVDGLEFIRRLAEQAVSLLKPGGLLALELHELTTEGAADYVRTLPFRDIQIHKDLAKRHRFLTAIRDD